MKKPRMAPQLPPPERRVVMGIIGAPHGVRGEMRFKSFTGDPLAIADYGVLFAADGRFFDIEAGRHLKDDMLVVRLSGIADRDAAQALTGTELFIDRSMLPPPEEDDEFYHADLIGLGVLDAQGATIGTIMAVHDYGAGDILEINPAIGGPSWLLPFTKVAALRVDLKARCVVIDPEFLAKPEASGPPPGAA